MAIAKSKHRKLIAEDFAEEDVFGKFKNTVEAFLNKDLKVEARAEGNQLIIEAKPLENVKCGCLGHAHCDEVRN